MLQVSNIASRIGNGIVVITVPWLVLELTGSPSAAGAFNVWRNTSDIESHCIFSERPLDQCICSAKWRECDCKHCCNG